MNARRFFSPTKKNTKSRRGAMLPLIAVLLPVLLIFLGFAVDLAYMQTTRLELQAAADSAARAGATRLAQTDDVTQARQLSREIAEQNRVAGAPLLLRDADVIIGRSVPDQSGRWKFTTGGTPSNAVRINASRAIGSRSGAVPLFFGSLVGTPSFEPVQSATASFANVDICLVLDRSSSMKKRPEEDGGMSASDSRFCRAPNEESRWIALDVAVRVFIDELQESEAVEQVALASYASDFSGSCGVSSSASSLDSPLNRDLTRTESALTRLTTSVWNGNTYIESGMRTGLAALQDRRYVRNTAERIMIVLTDGQENIGRALDAAEDCAADGVTVHSITFAVGAGQETMRAVAAAAGGRHYHAPDAASLKRVFRELAAQTARLTD